MVSFVKKDFLILKKYFDVKIYCYSGWKRGLSDLPRIIYGILTTDFNLSWFAYTQSYYAVFLSKLFNKKSIVIVGGFDVAEEETYEKYFNERRINQIKYTLDHADTILAVSKRLMNKSLKYTNRKDAKLIYHGFDYEYFIPKGEKENLVITAGYVKKDNLQRKGHETFVKTASYLPDTRFVLIGNHLDESINYLKSIASPNVEFTGWISDDELLKYFEKAKVYIQVSSHEGFGLSLAEAMLCECVPVVTDRGAIPEVVGDCGYYVPFNDSIATSEAIKTALNSNMGKKARERIVNLYPIKKREEELIKVIEDLI